MALVRGNISQRMVLVTVVSVRVVLVRVVIEGNFHLGVKGDEILYCINSGYVLKLFNVSAHAQLILKALT